MDPKVVAELDGARDYTVQLDAFHARLHVVQGHAGGVLEEASGEDVVAALDACAPSSSAGSEAP